MVSDPVREATPARTLPFGANGSAAPISATGEGELVTTTGEPLRPVSDLGTTIAPATQSAEDRRGLDGLITVRHAGSSQREPGMPELAWEREFGAAEGVANLCRFGSPFSACLLAASVTVRAGHKFWHQKSASTLQRGLTTAGSCSYWRSTDATKPGDNTPRIIYGRGDQSCRAW